MSSYGVIGTSPLRDLDKTPEKLLADYLKTNYDQSVTGIPIASIRFEQWGIAGGDYAIYFQDAGDFDVSGDVSNSFFETDHYTDIHVFARSLHDDYERSAVKQLFMLERWIKKVLRQGGLGMASNGIAYAYYKDTRSLPTEDETQDIRRVVISVYMKILTINNDNLV